MELEASRSRAASSRPATLFPASISRIPGSTFSFRQIGTFYEEIVNRIYTDLSETLQPRRLVVNGDFTARGGITSSVKIDSAEV